MINFFNFAVSLSSVYSNEVKLISEVESLLERSSMLLIHFETENTRYNFRVNHISLSNLVTGNKHNFE